ncbi:hypothetical protein PsYK624_085030 [Phanerochaete sordida]|uniref:Uncharacterized protein n=1 Tax=Phanerochaete sordida TaxID=48140 RepID=A0A9P3LF81_9APHY|nr:hypothetical protein PsYK624_085030 [Phanerochaete sordida]
MEATQPQAEISQQEPAQGAQTRESEPPITSEASESSESTAEVLPNCLLGEQFSYTYDQGLQQWVVKRDGS